MMTRGSQIERFRRILQKAVTDKYVNKACCASYKDIHAIMTENNTVN